MTLPPHLECWKRVCSWNLYAVKQLEIDIMHANVSDFLNKDCVLLFVKPGFVFLNAFNDSYYGESRIKHYENFSVLTR